MRIHSNDNRIAPKAREPHPTDRDETLAEYVTAFAVVWGFCLTIGIAIAAGILS